MFEYENIFIRIATKMNMNRNKIIGAFLYGILVCIVSSSPVTAQEHSPDEETIVELFERMTKAHSTISYLGRMDIERRINNIHRKFEKEIYFDPVHNRVEERILLEHDLEEQVGKIRERFQKDMQHKMSIRQRRMLQNYDRGMQRRMPAAGNLLNNPIHFEVLRNNYTIVRESEDSIAGRVADIIFIDPDYEFRPRNRIWVDKETGIILKREIYHPGIPDEPVYRELFTEIRIVESDEEIGLLSDEEVEQREVRQQNRIVQRAARPVSREFITLEQLPENHREKIIIPETLPPGFVLDKIRLIGPARANMYHQVYTDGLIMFSLFQVSGELPRQLQEFVSRASRRPRPQQQMFVLEGTVLVKRDNGTNFIVMGYVPEILLQPVLDSLPGDQE